MMTCIRSLFHRLFHEMEFIILEDLDEVMVRFYLWLILKENSVKAIKPHLKVNHSRSRTSLLLLVRVLLGQNPDQMVPPC